MAHPVHYLLIDNDTATNSQWWNDVNLELTHKYLSTNLNWAKVVRETQHSVADSKLLLATIQWQIELYKWQERNYSQSQPTIKIVQFQNKNN